MSIASIIAVFSVGIVVGFLIGITVLSAFVISGDESHKEENAIARKEENKNVD